MIDTPIIFYPTAILIIIFLMISLFVKNVIYSLLSAMVVFFLTSLIFFLLGSEYNGIIQAIIYGVAVPIIIAISIMFVNKNSEYKKTFTLPYITIISFCVFILAFVYIVMMSLVMVPETFNFMALTSAGTREILRIFAKGIFTNYVYGFELLSILLLIIVAGISLVKKEG